MGFNRRQNVLILREQSKFIKAILRNDKPMVNHLISNEEVNSCDVERRSPLHLCSSLGYKDIVEILIASGGRVNARDNEWLSPLHRACRNNHDLVVSLLLDSGAEANTRDKQWITPMHVCAANNALECAKVLLPKMSTIDSTDRSGATPLHHAVFNSHLDMISFLLQNNANSNAFDKTDRRPIHFAASVDSTDAIRFLVNEGMADVNVHDKDLMTPLHIASAKGAMNALHLLLDFGAKIHAIDVFGNSAVHWATVNGQEDIIEELILRGAYLGCVNHNGVTPLHLAASSSLSAGVLDLLLTHKDIIDVNFRDKFGRTALHFAAKYGRTNRIPDLVRSGAVMSIGDKCLATPLHYASGSGNTPVIDALITLGNSDVNLIDTNGMSSLHYAAFGGYSSACRRLLDASANSQICDTSGRTPHFYACYSGSKECLEMLMPLPLKLVDAFNRSLLHYASSASTCHSSECLDFLLNNFSDKFDVNLKDLNGLTALHFAMSKDAEDRCSADMLLKFGAKPDICDNNGFYALHYAAANGRTSSVESLIEAYDWKAVKMNVCPTHCASFYGRPDTLELLLRNGFQDIGPALQYAILKEDIPCVQILLDYLMNGSNLRFSSDIIKKSVLVSAQFALHNTLKVQLNYFNDIDITDERGRTPLMLAALNDSGENCVELLVKRRSNVNAIDANRCSPLFYAIYSGVETSVKTLLSYGAQPQSRCFNGKTAIHLASSLGRTEILWHLLHSDINHSMVSMTDRQGLTPIHWTALKSNASALEVLLEFESTKTLPNHRISPLHLAAFSSSVECFEHLVSHFGPQSLQVLDHKKRNVLHFSCLADNKNMKIIDILLSNGVDINCEDSAGRTPLMYASKVGNMKVVEYLISKGADMEAKDSKKNTALHICCIHSRDECGIQVLKSCQSLVNVTNADLKTPLHISAANGLVRLTQELLLKGASVNVSDADGMTASLCCAKNNEVADCLLLIESIMLSECESKSMCDMESASELRQSIIKRKSAQIFCDNNSTNVSFNNISDPHNSSDSDFY